MDRVQKVMKKINEEFIRDADAPCTSPMSTRFYSKRRTRNSKRLPTVYIHRSSDAMAIDRKWHLWKRAAFFFRSFSYFVLFRSFRKVHTIYLDGMRHALVVVLTCWVCVAFSFFILLRFLLLLLLLFAFFIEISNLFSSFRFGSGDVVISGVVYAVCASQRLDTFSFCCWIFRSKFLLLYCT